jgi:hypothetical protein
MGDQAVVNRRGGQHPHQIEGRRPSKGTKAHAGDHKQ